MSVTAKIIVWASATVILFDAVASTLSRFTHIPYGDFSIGSMAIFLAIGFFVSRSDPDSRPLQAISAAAVVGLADATFGWWISSSIGPGRPSHPLTAGIWLFTLFVVILNAAFCASVGYFAESRWLYRFRR